MNIWTGQLRKRISIHSHQALRMILGSILSGWDAQACETWFGINSVDRVGLCEDSECSLLFEGSKFVELAMR